MKEEQKRERLLPGGLAVREEDRLRSTAVIFGSCRVTRRIWFSTATQTKSAPLAEDQTFQMLAAGWLTGGVKSGAYARPAPYAQGSIIPGSNYSAQDNHDSLKVSGM